MIIEPWLIGGLIGLALGLSTYFMLGMVISKTGSDGRIDKGSPTHVLNVVRKADLVLMPLVCAGIGYFVFGAGR